MTKIDVSTPSFLNEFILIDQCKLKEFSKEKWTIDARGYAWRVESGVPRSLHREIVNAKPGDVVDHINGNTRDCRLVNLRICTKRQNCRNQKQKGQTSKFKGVSWHAERKAWQVKIRTDKGRLFVGRFTDEESAARAYDAAAIEHHGEYARTNTALGLLPELWTPT